MSRETFGNVVEYIHDKLYLASYTSTPNSSTPFPPSPIPQPYVSRYRSQHSPTKRKSGNTIAAPSEHLSPVYFTIDDVLLYNAFHHDFGPLHIGHCYRFALTLHDILGDPDNENKFVVLWSKNDPKTRANAACLLACYMVLVQSWPPHLALAPIAQVEPPFMPFRDAGYAQADFGLTIQDIVYGVWKAKEKGILNIREFNLDEYEKFERVDMGDFNWVSPNFLAFASPKVAPLKDGQKVPETLADVLASTNLSVAFKNVLSHFITRDVGLVVRLNSVLYPAEYFEGVGIQHLDMIFEDGTCPPLSLVRRFVNLSHKMITVHKKNIAVHCKAGLGRTGCLIGAYLIYKYGFSANEVISFMRFMRPGMVVGPQQHWLHLNQDTFRQWWFEDSYALAAAADDHESTAPRKRVPATPARQRAALGELTNEMEENQPLPAPTPGQPRKTSAKFYSPTRHREVQQENRSNTPTDDAEAPEPRTSISQSGSQRRKNNSQNGAPAPKRRSLGGGEAKTMSVKAEGGVTIEVSAAGGRSGAAGVVKVRTSPRRERISGGRKVSGSHTGRRVVSGGGFTSGGRGE